MADIDRKVAVLAPYRRLETICRKRNGYYLTRAGFGDAMPRCWEIPLDFPDDQKVNFGFENKNIKGASA
jgi:hypothetical protein